MCSYTVVMKMVSGSGYTLPCVHGTGIIKYILGIVCMYYFLCPTVFVSQLYHMHCIVLQTFFSDTLPTDCQRGPTLPWEPYLLSPSSDTPHIIALYYIMSVYFHIIILTGRPHPSIGTLSPLSSFCSASLLTIYGTIYYLI